MSTFTALERKYNGFVTPTYKITIDGTELLQSQHFVSEIRVDNSAGAEAGACSFTVAHVYEHGSRQFSPSVLSLLRPGGQVTVALGYDSDTAEVFQGYIDRLSMQFSEHEMSLSVMCMDARALMRKGAFYTAGGEKKIAEVVGAVLDRYRPLIRAKDVSGLKRDIGLTQTGDDLSFVVRAAHAHGLAFILDGGRAVIASPSDKVCVAFDWEQCDMDFSMGYLAVKYIARGYDRAQMEKITVEEQGKPSFQQTSLVTVVETIPLHDHEAREGGAAIAAKAAADRRASISGSISCSGIPEVRVGERVKINKFPLASLGVGDSFRIASVGHRFDLQEGFRTSIGLEG